MKKNYKRLICLLLIAVLTLQLSACVAQARAADLMQGVEPAEPLGEPFEPTDAQLDAAADFALRLFRAGNESGKNSLISPLSVAIALAMTANGAKGETLEQMEKTLGMTQGELNYYFYTLQQRLPHTEDCRLALADSIWYRDDGRLQVDRDFLQTNADFYGAAARSAPFDEKTLQEINDWVKEKTDGMIPEILDEIPANAVMYLVNALAFEAKWMDPYKKQDVQEGDFSAADGTERSVDFMYSEESAYLETGDAVGFLKYYKDERYAFAALLPREGLSPEALLETLDGAALRQLLTNAHWQTVRAGLPKFDTSFGAELSGALKELGMPLAFDPELADFAGMGSASGNLYINRVLHKTFISVAEQGTRAGAATAVEMNVKGAMPVEMKRVILDRPFVYMLIEVETGVPFFIGVLNDPGE